MQLGKKTQRRLIASFIFGILVFVLLAVFADVRGIAASLRSFNWWMLPAILALALGNYLLRFIRWHYYLKILDIALPIKDSLTVFMSGLAMSITPGKVGELVKSYFLKRMTDTAMRRSVPIVFAERFTDFLSVVVLAGIGAFSFHHGEKVVWLGLLITLAALAIVLSRPLTLRMIDVVAKLPFIHKTAETLRTLYENAHTLLTLRPLVIAFVLGFASWFCECVGFYLTIHALGFEMGVWQATFIYAFSTFIGAITFLPGGLGTTEGTMTGLTILHGLPKDAAAAATIVIRVATLWFAVALGLLWLAPNRDVLIPDKDEMEHLADS